MDNFKFKMKFYGLTELAQIYNPDCCSKTALARLREWIAHNPELTHKLIKFGWKKGNRILTPKQVKCIIEALGEP